MPISPVWQPTHLPLRSRIAAQPYDASVSMCAGHEALQPIVHTSRKAHVFVDTCPQITHMIAATKRRRLHTQPCSRLSTSSPAHIHHPNPEHHLSPGPPHRARSSRP